ncbi:MAG: hypothetical protein M3Y26_07025 [Actinomycetota bacterium]|nr:hypothetical protein [Actinomycetota bacterium]
MSVLPLSVRFALWGTAALHGVCSPQDAVEAAHQDVDDVAGDPAGQLASWRDFGETALLVALPRPGDAAGMPRAGFAEIGAAAAAGECVFVAGFGGLLVPHLSRFGPIGDEGTLATWTAYEAEPVPRHELESLSLGELDRELTVAVHDSSAALERVEGRPWSSEPRGLAERRLAPRDLDLPSGVSGRALRLLLSAARAAVIVDEGLRLAASGPTLDLFSSGRRESGLRDLQRTTGRVLAGATNLAVMELADWRPA